MTAGVLILPVTANGTSANGRDRKRGTVNSEREEPVVKREHLHAIPGSRAYTHTRSLCVSLLPGRKGRLAGTPDTNCQCETAFTSGTVTWTRALRNAQLSRKKFRPHNLMFRRERKSISNHSWLGFIGFAEQSSRTLFFHLRSYCDTRINIANKGVGNVGT